ncbi:MAG: hypothetical protein ACYCTV_02625 [Leptospirales bacterium]
MNLVRVSFVLGEETSLLHLFGITVPASLLDLPTLALHHRKGFKAGDKMKIPTKRVEIFLRYSDQEAFFVGVLADERKKIYFQHIPEFIRRGIDRVSVFPLKETVQDNQNRVFVGLPGLFFDSFGMAGGSSSWTVTWLRKAFSPRRRLYWISWTISGTEEWVLSSTGPLLRKKSLTNRRSISRRWPGKPLWFTKTVSITFFLDWP